MCRRVMGDGFDLAGIYMQRSTNKIFAIAGNAGRGDIGIVIKPRIDFLQMLHDVFQRLAAVIRIMRI